MLGYDAPRWHAVLNDLPAALLLVAVLFDLAAAATKRESLAWAASERCGAGVIGGWAAVVAGKLAEGAIEHGEAIHEIMEKHETMALLTMSLFTIVLIWKMAPAFQSRRRSWRLRARSASSLGGTHLDRGAGGRLMFQHAAGIPTQTLQAEIQDRAAGHAHEEGADTTNATHTHPPAHRRIPLISKFEMRNTLSLRTSSHGLHADHNPPLVHAIPRGAARRHQRVARGGHGSRASTAHRRLPFGPFREPPDAWLETREFAGTYKLRCGLILTRRGKRASQLRRCTVPQRIRHVCRAISSTQHRPVSGSAAPPSGYWLR